MDTQKKTSLKKFQISKDKLQNIKGGGIKKAFVDAHLCEIERKVSFLTGGNGSGDW